MPVSAMAKFAAGDADIRGEVFFGRSGAPRDHGEFLRAAGGRALPTFAGEEFADFAAREMHGREHDMIKAVPWRSWTMKFAKIGFHHLEAGFFRRASLKVNFPSGGHGLGFDDGGAALAVANDADDDVPRLRGG